ncbi:MAG: ComEA family DNA-binding protein [Lachnospiraceae bacterium]|nr:ComEA family DNA-binding protein [Lachnospiraceae bacterium]
MRSKQFSILSVFAGVLFPVIFVLCSCGQADNYYYEEVQEKSISEEEKYSGGETESFEDPSGSSNAGKSSEPESICVQVCGAVNRPGVYELSAGARVYEAIEQGGGLSQDAAIEAVNQAGVLEDGQMILVPTVDEWQTDKGSVEAQGNPADPQDDRVNINTADATLLQTIPGIGETRAQSIIAYRQEHGDFSAIEDIKKVSGIKDGLFQKIKDKIRV